MSEILYFKTELTAESPLIIGSGIGDNTDSDILIGGDGLPYIPGTTLAGICRHYLIKKIGEEKAKKVFGYTVPKQTESQKSNIIFYDAVLKEDQNKKENEEESYIISNRDGVRLNEHKNTENRGKFDYEIIEAGSVFEFRVELNCKDETDKKIIDHIVNGFNSHEIRIGAKTTRGFGKIKTGEKKIKNIDLKTNIQDYINFEWDNVIETYESIVDEEKQYATRNISFTLPSFLFIRNYATTEHVFDHTKENNVGKIVDAEQLLNNKKNPVIPGTSWAGVFRHHFERMLKKVNFGEERTKELINKVFGYVIDEGERKGEAHPSKIIFSESVIEKSRQLNRTRNAIDRFTGGAGDKKLFTTRPTYTGKGQLEIKLLKHVISSANPACHSEQSEESFDEFELTKSIIDACIKDLNEGFLSVGGETSTGGGLIKVAESDIEGEWK